ncbi:hypothetical protein JTB14_023977 [Gonioctena quinquepunctata]|nr:hypothetical protein JTB14_023977 [Gonioctena quinquepunctata]
MNTTKIAKKINFRPNVPKRRTTDSPNITSSRFPENRVDIRNKLIGRQNKQIHNHDESAEKLSELHPIVLIQEGVRSWKPAIIVEKFGPNDYLLKTEDMAEYRRNRYHIRPLREPPVNPTRSRQSADEENPDSQPNPEVLGRRSSIEHRDYTKWTYC